MKKTLKCIHNDFILLMTVKIGQALKDSRQAIRDHNHYSFLAHRQILVGLLTAVNQAKEAGFITAQEANKFWKADDFDDYPKVKLESQIKGL